MKRSTMEIYGNLYQLSNLIFKLYNKLSECYCNEDIDNFNLYLNMLKLETTLEKEYYNSFFNDYITMQNLMDLINNNSLYNYEDNSLFCLCDFSDKNELINYRIYNNLKLRLDNDNSYYISNLDDDLKIYSSNIDSIRYLRELSSLLVKEEKRRIFNLLDDNFVEKFMFIFLNPIIEDEVLKYNFVNLNNSFNDNINCVSKYDIFKDFIYSKYGIDNCLSFIEEIVNEVNDPELDVNDEDGMGYRCLSLLVKGLKANLLFVSSDKIEFLYKYYLTLLDKEKLNNNVDDEEYILDRGERFEYIKDLIDDVFEDNLDYMNDVNRDSKIKKLIK